LRVAASGHGTPDPPEELPEPPARMYFVSEALQADALEPFGDLAFVTSEKH
jgi:hypothetical protein